MNRIKFSNDGVKRVLNLLNEFNSEKKTDFKNNFFNTFISIKILKLRMFHLNIQIEPSKF